MQNGNRIMSISFERGRWSPATQRAYRQNWTDFSGYCFHDAADQAISACPADPDTVAGYLKHLAQCGLSTSTISQRLAAIIAAHDLAGHALHTKGTVIADTWAEIRRTKGTAKTPKRALTAEDIKTILRAMPATTYQDRAMILLHYGMAGRRSEIAALNVEDVAIDADGLLVTIRRSKTDKAGAGATIAIPRTGSPFCPVAAVEAYLTSAPIDSGPLFRGPSGSRIAPHTINERLKRHVAAAGFSPEEVRQIASHSLRRGRITTAFKAGVLLRDVMDLSRHKTPAICLGYVQSETARNNPAAHAHGLG